MRWPWRQKKIQTNKFFNQSDDYSILCTRVLDMIIKISWTSSGESTERTSCEDTEKNPSKFPIYKRQIRICHVRFVTLNSVIIQLAVLHRISEMVATDATVWIAGPQESIIVVAAVFIVMTMPRRHGLKALNAVVAAVMLH